MSTALAELIPSHRFGQLLAEKRLASGIDLDDLALQSGHRFTAAELAAIESGRLSVPDTVIPVLSELYDVPFGEVVPHRAKLCLDLHAKYMRVAHLETPLDVISQKAILDRYLSLLYLVRGVEPGTEQIPLRGDDLAILEASLRERSELIEEQLLAAMVAADPKLKSLLDRLRKKLWVPGAGLFVGSVGIGALVFAAAPDDTDSGGLGGGDQAANSFVIEEPIGFAFPEGLTIDEQTQVLSGTESTPATSPATTPSTSSSSTSTSSTSTSSTSTSTSSTIPPVPRQNAAWLSRLTVDSEVDPQLVVEAVGRLGFDVEATLPEWEVVFLGPKQGFRGLTFTHEKRIELYVRPSDTSGFVASVLAHELGHAYDLTYLDDGFRRSWMDARGLDQWWVGSGLTDFQAGQGDFAEAFAFAVAGDEIHPQSHGAVTPEEAEVLAGILQFLQ